jgi:folate-binding protein YgfZ
VAEPQATRSPASWRRRLGRWWAWLDRDVISVTGVESGSYLQGQLSQDVQRLSQDGTTWSWILAPTGKVDALVRVQRIGEEAWILDTDRGWGQAVAARLARFKLRTRVDFEALESRVLALRGEGWEAQVPGGFPRAEPWPGVAGSDLFDPPQEVVAAVAAASPPVGPKEVEVARIVAGIPLMGAELTERTIPAETGLVELTVSFDKGCYTGQELVARIDSRGSNVPRRLRFVWLTESAEPGCALFDGDQEVGSLTSVGRSSLPGWDEMGWVALGYIRRGFDPPLSLTAGPGGPAAAVPDLA